MCAIAGERYMNSDPLLFSPSSSLSLSQSEETVCGIVRHSLRSGNTEMKVRVFELLAALCLYSPRGLQSVCVVCMCMYVCVCVCVVCVCVCVCVCSGKEIHVVCGNIYFQFVIYLQSQGLPGGVEVWDGGSLLRDMPCAG